MQDPIHCGGHVTPDVLATATRGELGPEALRLPGELGACPYAFQVFDIKVLDRFPERDVEASDLEYASMVAATPTVCLFGVDVDGRSVLLRVRGYRPYLYLEVPWLHGGIPRPEIKPRVLAELEPVIGKQDLSKVRMAVETAHKLGGYCPPRSGQAGIASFHFIRLEFPNLFLYQCAAKALKRSRALGSRIAEDRIPHTIKFCDAVRRATGAACDPCSWVGCARSSWRPSRSRGATSSWRPRWRRPTRPHVSRLAPVMVASYDIECTSPSGTSRTRAAPTTSWW